MEEIAFKNTTPKDKDTIKVIALYVVFVVILIVQVLPQMNVQLLALILLAVLGAIIGFLRRESDKDSMMHNHATYLSRTLWFWGLLLGIGTGLIFVYLTQTYDVERLQGLAQSMIQGQYTTPEFRRLMIVGAIGMAPSFIYLFPRIVRGLYYAAKGRKLPNPKRLL